MHHPSTVLLIWHSSYPTICQHLFFFFCFCQNLKRVCYDHERQSWCIIKRIDVETGGVYVIYEYTADEVLVPADSLVGLPLSGESRNDHPEKSATVTVHEWQDELVDNLENDRRVGNDLKIPARKRKRPRSDSLDQEGRGLESEDEVVEGDQAEMDATSHRVGNINDLESDCQPSDQSEKGNISDLEEEPHKQNDFGEEKEEVDNQCQASPFQSSQGDESDGSVDRIDCSEVTVRDCMNHGGSLPSIAEPPSFLIGKDDPFVKPRVGELVTYLYHPDQYFVGLLCSKKGKIRFFHRRDVDGEPIFSDHEFYLTKTWFRKGQFRARPKLKPNRYATSNLQQYRAIFSK